MDLTPEKPLAGLLAPLFALRGENDLGIGDVGALREFVRWAAEHGFGVVQILPVNETGNDNSPYNAISSVALDPPTIEITPEAVPDLSAADIAEVSGDQLKDLLRGAVIYPRVKALKLHLLERAFTNYRAGSAKKNDKRARVFRTFRREQKAWLEPYAFFRTLMERNSGSERWDHWPEEQQSFAKAQQWVVALPPAERKALQERARFFMYVQWIAWTQWAGVREDAAAHRVALMGDIPFGVSLFSADVWAVPELFDHKWSGGAPPERVFQADPFTTKWGQNWGIPLYPWDVHRAEDFAWWRQRVAKVREIFHLFRIDHILGFYRIYSFPWRPDRNAEFLPLTEEEAKARTGGELPHFTPNEDDTPEHKAANRAQGEELLRVLLQECGEYRLIGEDLGEVPDYVRPSLTELGIAGFKIPIWENEPDGSMIPGDKYQRLSVTTYATHDFEPLRTTWENWMASISRADDGNPATVAARDHAWKEARRLARWARFELPQIAPYPGEVHERLLQALFKSNAWIAIMMVTDLFATSQRFNVPGAVSDANWSERIAEPIAKWDHDEAMVRTLRRVEPMLRETRRWHE
ncbi:MAG: 4-alpha-glucanotransferase [Chthoniobacter sp.]|jgi:4-alpha-glucanotransferase|nr:4-alpha-glucanotransferase [Chthoniobacter sp.]